MSWTKKSRTRVSESGRVAQIPRAGRRDWKRAHGGRARARVETCARGRVRPLSFTWEAQAAGEARGARSGESGKL